MITTIWAVYYDETLIGAAQNQNTMVSLLADYRLLDDDTPSPYSNATLIDEFGEDYLNYVAMLPLYEFQNYIHDLNITYREIDLYEL